MLDMLLNFERSAVFFDSTVFISAGIVAVAIGIVMWIAGMAFRRLFLIITGAITGMITGFSFIGKQTVSAIGLAGLFAVVALVFDRLFVTILAVSLAAMIAFCMLTWHYDATANLDPPVKKINTPMNAQQTLNFFFNFSANFINYAKDISRNIPPYGWLIIPLLIVAFTAGGIFFWNLICAWCWSTLGTTFIFGGMVSLLLYKGSTPITCFFHKSAFYIPAFVGMTCIGTLVQLLLFRDLNAPIIKKHTETDNLEQQSSPQRWRGL